MWEGVFIKIKVEAASKMGVSVQVTPCCDLKE